MSTTGSTTTPQKVDFDAVISRRLLSFSRRRWRLLAGRAALAALTVFIVAMFIIMLCDYLWFLPEPVRFSLSLCGYAVTGLAAWWYGLREYSQTDPRTLARQIESVDPRLREDLLSAVELADPHDVNGSPFFLERLKRTVAHQVASLDPRSLLPVGLLHRWFAIAGVLVVLVIGFAFLPAVQLGQRMARAALPGIPIQRVSRTNIEIIAPTPASRDVAQGDAVGVVVRTSGDEVERVTLQWASDDGQRGEAVMTRRGAEEYSANLPIGTSPVSYRIRGGDCITLWERLTPRSRPHATSFEIRYRFPEYTQLEDEVFTAEHGDLRAITGTVAEVTVVFDQQVTEALMRFDGGRYEVNLIPDDEERTRFKTELPIRSPATYNVDSVSRSSGLNNPFSSRYSITPITDSPPVVRWAEELPQTQLVSPLDIVDLAVSAHDDLPLDEARQLFQVNGSDWFVQPVAIETPAKELDAAWKWDLTSIADAAPEKRSKNPASLTSLSPGDLIRTRVVVTDRRGHSGETRLLELLVTDEGFASDRHDDLHVLADFVTLLSQWLQSVKPIPQLATESKDSPPQSYFVLLNEQVPALRTNAADLRRSLVRLLGKAKQSSDADMLERVGRAIDDLDRRLMIAMKVAEASIAIDEKVVPLDWKDFVRESRELESLTTMTDQYAKSLLSQEVLLGVASDAYSLVASLDPLIDAENDIPDDRWPRYISIALQRTRDINQLMGQHAASLPDSTNQQFNRWIEWSNTWDSRLELAIDEFPGEDNARSTMRDFQNELRSRIGYSLFDQNVAGTLRDTAKRFPQQTILTHAAHIEQLRRLGSDSSKLLQSTERESDSEKISKSRRQAAENELRRSIATAGLLDRLSGDDSLQRTRVFSDLRYAADLTLAKRAIENVTKDGFKPYKDEDTETVHRAIGQALARLEVMHWLRQSERQMIELLASQQRPQEDATSRFVDPLRFEIVQALLEASDQTMQNAGVAWQQIEPFATLRYNEPANRIANQLGSRRYKNEPPVPVILPLQENSELLEAAIVRLEPIAREARATLEKYVLSLPEQARKAAKLAEQAEKQIEQREDSSKPTQQTAQELQQDAEQATRDTIQALVDLANNSDFLDAEQRELARDADAAATQLNQAAQETNQAMERAAAATNDSIRAEELEKTQAALAAMKEKLEQTAEHFENAAQGKDISESRDDLRQAEHELGIDDALQQRYDDTAKMAERTQSDPQKMLEALERELNRNEPMQDELEKIADQSAEMAQRVLEQAVQDERSLQSEIERSDATFDEQKQQMQAQLRAAAKRASNVDQALLNATERALGWNKPREETDELRETREKLRNAANEAQRVDSNAPLDEFKQASQELAGAVKSAKEWTDKLSERAKQEAERSTEEDKKQQRNAASQAESIEKSTRDQRARDEEQVKNLWKQAEDQAKSRVRNSENLQKRHQESVKRLTDQLKKQPENESLKQQIAKEQERAESAKHAAEQGNTSREFAEQQRKIAENRASEIRKLSLQPWDDAPRPTMELTEKLSRQAAQELNNINQELDELQQQSQIDDSLRVPEDTANSLSNRQQHLNEEVKLAAEMLARAARHQERLGQSAAAEELDRAAAEVGRTASETLDEAKQSLSEIADAPTQSSQASGQLAKAHAELAQQAAKVAELVAKQAPKSQAASETSEPAGGEPTTPQKLARTLDELDQSLNSSAESAASQPSGEQQPGQKQPGSSPQTAGQASQTLADAAQSQAQQAAKQRQAQASPQSPGEGEGEASDEMGEPAEPGTQSAGGNMPRGGDVDTTGVVRVGDDWGRLRERRTDDAVEDRAANLPSGYRREIEAYFRAIAEKAAKK